MVLSEISFSYKNKDRIRI